MPAFDLNCFFVDLANPLAASEDYYFSVYAIKKVYHRVVLLLKSKAHNISLFIRKHVSGTLQG